MRAVRSVLMLLCLLNGMGAHWVGLQAFAWAKMSVDGATSPCRICRLVDQGRRAEKPSAAAHAPSATPAFQPRPALPVALRPLGLVPARRCAARSSCPPPSVPPPKALA